MKILIFIVCMLLASCAGTLKVSNVDYLNKYIQYNKVKLKFKNISSGEYDLRGYIFVSRDSLICFKFYGPLSVEILSGIYENNLIVYDHINGVLHQDVMDQMIRKSGILFNKICFEYLLLGDPGKLKEETDRLNNGLIRSDLKNETKKKLLSIYNPVRNNQMNFKFSFRQNFPVKILVDYKDVQESWSLEMDILQVSNEKRNCRFKY